MMLSYYVLYYPIINLKNSRKKIMLYMHGVAGELMSILLVSETFRQMLESAEHY